MPPHLKKSINQAHLETGTYEQIVSHLQMELELNGLEAPDEQQINIVSQHATNIKADIPKVTCHHCKKPGHYRNRCSSLKKNSGIKLKILKIILETDTVTPITLSQTTIRTTSTTKSAMQNGSQKLFIHPLRHVARRTTPQRDVMLEPMQQTGHFAGRANLNNRTQRAV